MAGISRIAALSLLLAALAGRCGPAWADGLLRLADCRIVDDHGPVKAMGVNYVDGFWRFAVDRRRETYLPYLDALAEAKIPFIRMAFGPWAAYDARRPAPAIADFVARRGEYFDLLDRFLADAKARHIGVVLDVFWNIDPYTVYFDEPLAAIARPDSRTSAFLREVVAELARRHGRDSTIWMIEFLNEGNLEVDYPRAPHALADLVALLEGLATALREAGDRHLVDSGNSLPRPAAERLSRRQGWAPDGLADFLRALDAETPVEVASAHIYPEKPGARPWDGDDVLNTLPRLAEHGLSACHPVFVGEFGATDPALEESYVTRIAASGVPLAAAWGFGRPAFDPMAFGIDAPGRARLARLTAPPLPPRASAPPLPQRAGAPPPRGDRAGAP
jgi:hypothetical protein